MSSFLKVLPKHHQHCDALFIAAEESAQNRDWLAAKSAFEQFNEQMHAHFEAEETILFPAFEDATGMIQGPTQMMRLEHQQMRSVLAQVQAACAAEDGEAYAGLAETLLILMQQHNMKEEHILYPMCEEALTEEAEELGSRIAAGLGGA
jgi:hemerythrin-like domain-containing protein